MNPKHAKLTFDQMHRLWARDGATDAEHEAYCYAWRDAGYRFSGLGKQSAIRHARNNGLPLAYSDLTLAEREARHA